MIQKTLSTVLFCLVCYTTTLAQDVIQSKYYPKDAFRYPLDLPPSTAGSFGELRPNHFHSGLILKPTSVLATPYFR
jgi:hypothetical protein